MKSRKRLTILSPSDAVVVMDLYKSGHSRAEIARKYGVSFAAIENIINGYNLTHNMDNVKIAEGTEEEIKEFIKQRNEGKAWRDIAKAVGRSGVWVQQKVENYEREQELSESKKTIVSLKDEIEAMKQYIEQMNKRITIDEPLLTITKKDWLMVEWFDLEWIGYIMLGCIEAAIGRTTSFYDAATPDVKAAMYHILERNNVATTKDKSLKQESQLNNSWHTT